MVLETDCTSRPFVFDESSRSTSVCACPPLFYNLSMTTLSRSPAEDIYGLRCWRQRGISASHSHPPSFPAFRGAVFLFLEGVGGNRPFMGGFRWCDVAKRLRLRQNGLYVYTRRFTILNSIVYQTLTEWRYCSFFKYRESSSSHHARSCKELAPNTNGGHQRHWLSENIFSTFRALTGTQLRHDRLQTRVAKNHNFARQWS